MRANDLGSDNDYGWRSQRYIRALLDGDLPLERPYLAGHTIKVARNALGKGDFTPAAEEYLHEVIATLEPYTETADEAAVQEAENNTAAAEAKHTPGVYVYALPHYLRHPVNGDFTLMKVGHSRSGAIQRFRQQTGTTALPEEPILLRIYPTEDSASAERAFHRLLHAAGHSRPTRRGAGREWFVDGAHRKSAPVPAEIPHL